MHKKLSVGILFILVLIVSLPYADAQRPTQQILQELEKRDKYNCEVWQINEFFHLPIRVNLIHEPVTDHEVSVKSQDPASEVFWEGSKESFQMVTASPDRHTIEVVLDYELKHEEPRQVFYQVFSQDNIMMMEGNWVHEGFTFCKVIEMSTSEAPHILTTDEIQEANNKFNLDFKQDTLEKFTAIENSQITYGILLLLIGIIGGIFLIVVLLMFRKLASVANKPVKKLEEMIDIHRNVNKNLANVSDRIFSMMSEMQRSLTSTVDKKIGDLMIVTQATKKAVETSEAFVKPSGLVSIDKSKPKTEPKVESKEEPVVESTITAKLKKPFSKILGKKISEDADKPKESGGYILEDKVVPTTWTEKDEKIKQEHLQSMKEEGMVEPTELSRTVDHETAFDNDGIIEQTSTTKTKFEHPKNEVGEDLDSVDAGEIPELVEMDNIPECDTCGEITDDMLLCPHCNKVYCSQHEPDHKCLSDEPESEPSHHKETIKKIGGQVKEQFIEPKPPKVTDDEAIQKSLDVGTPPQMIQNQLVELWMKNSRKENEITYDVLRKQYSMTPTIVIGIKLNAMILVLNQQLRN